MPFTPPDLKTLKVNTNNLDVHFSTLLGRYQITEPNVSKVNTLELLIARINKLTTESESDRSSQLSVFTQLVNELRTTSHEGSDIQRARATQILLGALVHRYFRLINSYKTRSEKTTFFFWGPMLSPDQVITCRLFKSIREVLQLNDKIDNYKEKDLKKLDKVTVVTALESFQEYMLSNEQYNEYSHFRSNDNGKNFFQQLQDIIQEHKIQAKSILHLFSAITFLQSLQKKLCEEHEHVIIGLDNWYSFLKADNKQFGPLSAATLSEHLQQYVSDPKLNARFIQLLATPFIGDILYNSEDEELKQSTSIEQFIDRMKECNSFWASYTMLGGYSLILELTEQLLMSMAENYKINSATLSSNELVDALHNQLLTEEDSTHLKSIEHLQYCIYQALNIENERISLTKKIKSQGLRFLQEFIDTEPQLNIDCFENSAHFKTAIARLGQKLSKPDLSQEQVSKPNRTFSI